jgi:hypothetical protein
MSGSPDHHSAGRRDPHDDRQRVWNLIGRGELPAYGPRNSARRLKLSDVQQLAVLGEPIGVDEAARILHCPTDDVRALSRPAQTAARQSLPCLPTTSRRARPAQRRRLARHPNPLRACRPRADLRCGADPLHQQARDPRVRGGRAAPRRTGPPGLLLVPRRPHRAGRPRPSRPREPRHQPTRRRQRAAVGAPIVVNHAVGGCSRRSQCGGPAWSASEHTAYRSPREELPSRRRPRARRRYSRVYGRR